MCVRELLFNIVKHARATWAAAAMQWISAGLQIEVMDDGTGFPPNAAGEDVDKETIEEEVQPSFGLTTIRHQLSLYRGSLEIHSHPGAGTRMILIVPAAQTE